MTLLGTYLNLKQPGRLGWYAIWRTPAGNAIHDHLEGLNFVGTSEADAWIYAFDHYPSLEGLA